MVAFESGGLAPVSPSSEIPRGSEVSPTSVVLSSARRALKEADVFLSSHESSMLAREGAVSQRERVAQQLAARAAEELAMAKAEREWLDARRGEMEEEARRKAVGHLKDGQDALAAVRQKLIADSNSFDAVRRDAQARVQVLKQDLAATRRQVEEERARTQTAEEGLRKAGEDSAPSSLPWRGRPPPPRPRSRSCLSPPPNRRACSGKLPAVCSSRFTASSRFLCVTVMRSISRRWAA